LPLRGRHPHRQRRATSQALPPRCDHDSRHPPHPRPSKPVGQLHQEDRGPDLEPSSSRSRPLCPHQRTPPEAVIERTPPPPDNVASLDAARTPPRDVLAKAAVLGALLLNPDVLTDVAAILDPADYYEPKHQTIHRAITRLVTAGQRPDGVLVAAAL